MKRAIPTQATSRYRATNQRGRSGMFQLRFLGLLFLMFGLMAAGSVAAADSRSDEKTATTRSSTTSTTRTGSTTARRAADATVTSRAAQAEAAKKTAEAAKKDAEAAKKAADQKKREAATQPTSTATRQNASATSQSRTTTRQAESTARQTESTTRQAEGTGRQTEATTRHAESTGRQTEAAADRSTTRSQQAVNTRSPEGRSAAPNYRIQPIDVRARDNSRPGQAQAEGRYYQMMSHKSAYRYLYDNQRCRFCFGVGYTYGHNHLFRLRCPHCMGRGYDIQYHANLLDVCPICYGSVNAYGFNHHRSIQQTAEYMTRQLDYVLRLSRNQEHRVNRINLDYLRNSYRGDLDYWIGQRDDQLMRVLNYRQRSQYVAYTRHLDYRDICNNCFDMYY